MSGVSQRGILGPHVYEDVPFHEHSFDEISGELIITEAQITTLSATKITSGTITAQTITMAAGGIIRSDDFVTGPGGAGYELSQGLAEFNNITVRGTIFTGAGSDVDYAHVTSVAIDTVDLVNLAVTAGKIDLLTITGAQIANGTITATQIDALTITASEIANGTITATQIDDLTITAGKIGNLEITATQIDNLTITGGKIAGNTIPDSKIQALNVAKLTAGTIGVHVIKLSNSASSRIESSNGTSMIIRGDGTAVFTSVTITGTVNASAGSITGNLTVAGQFNLPNSTAGNRIRIIGGASPDIQIQASGGQGQTGSRLTLRNAGGLIGSLYPARSGSVDFVFLEATSAAEYLYIHAGSSNTTVEIVGIGRRTGDSGIGNHFSVTHGIGMLTKGTGDTPFVITHADTLPGGGTHVLIQNNESQNAAEFHLKMITRGGTDQTNFEFRMDGRAEAQGSTEGWVTVSDSRAKKYKKLVDVQDMIERIKSIPIIQFAMKGEAKGRPRKIGATAQDVQKAFPRSVSAGSSGLLGMNSEETSWALVSVVQDLLRRIDTLEAQAA